MTTKNSDRPRSDFSETPLQALHAYSLFWLKEIAFCKDEVAFFYHLLRKKIEKNPLPMKTEEARQIEKQLVHTSVSTLTDLERDILSHEKFLSRIMENPELDEQLFRDQHQKLYVRMHQFEQEYRALKKGIFELSKDPAFHLE